MGFWTKYIYTLTFIEYIDKMKKIPLNKLKLMICQ